MYSYAADSFCQRKFFAPYDKIIWQTEKQCFPHTWVANHYPNVPTKYKGSPWCYLNNGGYCGSTKLVVEFFERYGLHELAPEATAQHEVMLAYIKAKADDFPIFLDDGCELMQSMAFSPDMQDFEILKYNQLDSVAVFNNTRISLGEDVKMEEYKVVCNKVTGQVPAVLHFNGLTDMSILKELK
jgi:hypothetical protein